MPLKLKSLDNQEPGAGGGSNKMPAKNKKTIESLAARMSKVVPKTMSNQDLSRAFSIVRGMLKTPEAKKAGGKVKKAKGMARGGKTAMKSKGMKRGGKMKSKGMKRGGKAKR